MNSSILPSQFKIIVFVAEDFINSYANQKLFESAKVAKKVIAFHKANEAINYLKIVDQLYDKSGNNCIDLIILDTNISQMDIWGFIEQFKKMCANYESHIKVVVVSDTLNEEQITQLKSENLIVGFIQKPINHSKIIDCLSAIPKLT